MRISSTVISVLPSISSYKPGFECPLSINRIDKNNNEVVTPLYLKEAHPSPFIKIIKFEKKIVVKNENVILLKRSLRLDIPKKRV